MRLSDSNNLLNECLRESDYEVFRGELLEQATDEFRKAHPSRELSPWVLPLAASLLLLGLITAFLVRNPPSSENSVAIGKPLKAQERGKSLAPDWQFSSSALQPSQLVSTVIIAAYVETEPLNKIYLVESSSTPVDMILTPADAVVTTVSDAELLALFPEEPVLLVNKSGGNKAFFLLDETATPMETHE